MNSIGLFFFISLVFSPFAGAIAFFITYEEYTKHVGKKQTLKHAFEMALFTFIVFVVLEVLAGLFFSKSFQNN